MQYSIFTWIQFQHQICPKHDPNTSAKAEGMAAAWRLQDAIPPVAGTAFQSCLGIHSPLSKRV